MEAIAADQPLTTEATTKAPGRRPRLVFVGFMGSGKTSAARSVAATLGERSIDSDAELERRLGEPIQTFFEREGEDAFRAREEEMVLELLERGEGSVVALGGGSLVSARVRSALEEHIVVHLEVGLDAAWRRASGKGRPLARDRAQFSSLYEHRRPQYEALADAALPPADRGVARRALPALTALARAPKGTRLLWASAASGEYPVFVARGLLASAFFHPVREAAQRFVVTDTGVARHHSLIDEPAGAAIPEGEAAKTLTTAESVLRSMAHAGLTRDDLLVALGGGVVGDVAGFCAAVYQRGIDYVQIPTTLVAQVDSAYGGKTGVDLPEGKNYVGAYHQPAAVLVDPATLETLPARERSAGYAEVLKTALIAGGTLWARVREGRPLDDATILGCIRTKLDVVREDERDAARRQVLNLGHTVGHAIEAATSYTRYRHGEAVGIGILCALRLSGRDSLRGEVAELLRSHGLPLSFEGASVDDVVSLVARDKKRHGDDVPFVLVEAPGRVTPGHRVDESDLRAAVAEVHT